MGIALNQRDLVVGGGEGFAEVLVGADVLSMVWRYSSVVSTMFGEREESRATERSHRERRTASCRRAGRCRRGVGRRGPFGCCLVALGDREGALLVGEWRAAWLREARAASASARSRTAIWRCESATHACGFGPTRLGKRDDQAARSAPAQPAYHGDLQSGCGTTNLRDAIAESIGAGDDRAVFEAAADVVGELLWQTDSGSSGSLHRAIRTTWSRSEGRSSLAQLGRG